MIKIDIVKIVPGTPDDKIIAKEIIDENIINYPYALRICNYIIESQGQKWWKATGTTAATEIINRGDSVEFISDNTIYNGFIPIHPSFNYNISQGKVSMTWNVTIWFLI